MRLAFIQQRATLQPDAPRLPLRDEDAAAWVDTLSSLRAGFPRLAAPGRATAVNVACRILDKFAVEPAPAIWSESLEADSRLLTASLCDAEPLPRYTALVEVSRLWVWIPGRSLTPFEEQTLGEWKGAIHVPVVRCLAAPDPETRIAAVACLGALPIDSAAASAVAYVDDPIADVRKQTLSSFSQRNLLLTDDLLLKRLHDDDAQPPRDGEPDLEDQRIVAGTDQSGRLDLQPATRAARLGDSSLEEPNRPRSRHLADPAFARSRRDGSDELDRGIGEHKEPSVQRRLAEMARSDGSPAIRQAASKVVPPADGETTAALPPLPGSSSLNPKAN